MNQGINLKSKDYFQMMVFTFLCASAAALIQPYQSVFLRDMKNASSGQIGMFVSVNSITGIFFSTLFAKISDKHKRRKVLLSIALCSAIIGYICYELISDFSLLLIVSMIFIGVSTMITAQTFAYAKEILKNEIKDTEPYITMLRTCVSIAWVLSPVLAAVLIKTLKYRGIIGGTILSYIVAFLILQLCFRNRIEDTKVGFFENEETYEHKPYVYIFINFIVFTLLETMNVIANTNVPLYVTGVMGYSNKYVGFLTGLAALMEIPCMLFLAYLSYRKICMEHMVLFGIGSGILFFILLKEIRNIYIIMLLLVFKSIFNATYKGIGIVFFQKMIPQNCGTSTTIFTNTTRMGSIVGGVVIGSVGGYQNNFFYVAAGIGILSFLLYIWSYNTEKTKEKS